MSWSLEAMNGLSATEFVRIFSPVFERSPWIAERTEKLRPFSDVAQLHQIMCDLVTASSADAQLQLIRAHPDLVGRTVLTAESQGEQSAAGLTNLSREEVALFDRYNREYKARFDFPFVICARLNKKEAILKAFPERLQNSPDAERETALAEIYKIASLRLTDLVNS